MKLPWRVATYGPAIYTSLTDAEAQELVRLSAGKWVLEVGAAYGYSTVLLAENAKHVDSVDPHETHQSLDSLRSNLREYGIARRVEVHIGFSSEVLPKLRAATYDLVFIDGDHTAPGVAHDLEHALRLAAPEGVLAFHDWNEETCPGVRQALEAWRQPDYIVDTLAVFQLA